jgi:hypothetical protein
VTLGATPPTVGRNTLYLTGTMTLTIKVPSESVATYIAWKTSTNLAIPGGKTVTIEAL